MRRICCAPPPHLACRPEGYLVGSVLSILGGMPLLRDCRVAGTERRGRRSEDATADRATSAPRAAHYDGRPFVRAVLRASPPDAATAPAHHVGGRELAVPSWVPLSGDLGVCGPKRRLRRHSLPRAHGTTELLPGTTVDHGLPLVGWILRAFPPDLPVAARTHVTRGEIAVASRVPFVRQVRMERGERSRRRHPMAGAKGAAVASMGSLSDRRLPFV